MSIEDVAARAGVSAATVSRALRGLPNVAPDTRRRVEAAARELDYVQDPAAARLAAGRTGTIGLVLPGLGAWYHAQISAAVHGVCSAASLDLLTTVVDDHDERRRFLRDLPFRKRVDGLLVVDLPFTPDELDRLSDTGVAVVVTGGSAGRVPSLGIDDRAAARSVVDHLLGLGHTSPALLEGSPSHPFQFRAPTERRAGIAEGLADAGVDIDACSSVLTGWTAADGVDGTRRLLEQADEPPTAIIAHCDEMAFGAITALRAAGLRVPEDVAVTGFDDHEHAVHFDLTTVRQPVLTLGRRAAQRVLDGIADPGAAPTHDVLPTDLVVRGTTAPARTTDLD